MRGYEVDEMVAAHCREVGMSKHKTAAEWGDRIRDGLKLTMVEVGELVADLAACEAELVLANNTVTDCETRMADIVAERDRLRGELKDYWEFYVAATTYNMLGVNIIKARIESKKEGKC